MLCGQARRRGWAHLPSMWDPAWSAGRVRQDREVPVPPVCEAPSLCLCPVMSTSPHIRATLPGGNLPRASLRVMPGPISQILGRFGVQGVCLGWKRADQGRVVAKPSKPQPRWSRPHPGSHPKRWLSWPRCTPPQMFTIFGTC